MSAGLAAVSGVQIPPAAPRKLLSDFGLWLADGRLLLATLEAASVRIRDVTCAMSGACSLPAPIATLAVPEPTGRPQERLTVSQDAGRTFLYVGNLVVPGFVDEREYLVDVTHPTSARFLRNGASGSCWRPFYRDCGGVPDFAPSAGIVIGGRLFRAAHARLDTHITVPLPVGLVFADGFESGTTGAWRVP